MKAWEDFNCTYRPADKGGLYLKGHRRERRLPNARGSRGLSPSLSSLCLLLSLSLSRSSFLSPSVSLDHALQNSSLHDLWEEEEKKGRKVGQGDLFFFFFPQFTEAEGGGVIVG